MPKEHKNESDADVEKQFNESTGKKREYHPFLQYTEVMRWKTGLGELVGWSETQDFHAALRKHNIKP